MGHITHTFTKDYSQVRLTETFTSAGEAEGGVAT